MVKRKVNDRLLPALDESVAYAMSKGWITPADMAGIAQAYVVAGVIDNATLKPTELAGLCRQFQQILDSYKLSSVGRGQEEEEAEGNSPLDKLREVVRTVKPKNTDDNLYHLP
jgi:capsid portal protein